MDIHIQINKLIQKTIENKIDWKSINQNAFRWTIQKETNQFITTFQAVNIPQNILDNNIQNMIGIIGNGTFIFTLQTTNPGETIIQLQVTQTTNNEYLNELIKLYKIIAEKTKKDYSKILDDLLDNL
ncbi:MAG: hypothetical protein EBR38_05645 [Flavobacteriaceae bacterium]|nr:hypothetical protein [Flavobacteriaceae bacterium]